MAKSRRNRARPHRSDPMAKQAKPPSDPQLAALREEKILPVLKDLQSSEPKQRTSAAGAIANIIQDSKCRKLLLREQVVHIVLTETLTDSSLESRAAGWEILHVLAREEESDFCVHLYRSDVLTAAEHASKLIIETLTAVDPPFAKAIQSQQRFLWDITTSVVSLLSALAESREEILGAIAANSALCRLLYHLVSSGSAPIQVLEEALSCLATLSEDNRNLAQAVVDDQVSGCYPKLLKFREAGGSKAVLACALLHNVFSALDWHDQSPGKDGACDAILVPSLSRILERTKLETSLSNGNQGLDSAEILQLALDVLASIGTDLQNSLEKGNRDETEWGGFGDDEMLDDDRADTAVQNQSDEEDHEMGEDDDGPGEMDREEIEADMDMVTGADDKGSQADGIDDLPTLRELIRKAVPQGIRLARIEVTSDEAGAVQNSALSALNNIAWTVSCIEFAGGENANILQAWSPAARNIWSKVITPILSSDTADLGLAALVASLAWAVSRSLGGNTPLQDGEHYKIVSLYKASSGLGQESDDPFQSLGVKCVGLLGQLARDPAPVSVNREIGVFLVSLLAELPKTPAADSVEALNQLFDIYGDEDFACDKDVFWKGDFLTHLEGILPKARAMAKLIDKRTSTELRTRADESVQNLAQFIQYKRAHKP